MYSKRKEEALLVSICAEVQVEISASETHFQNSTVVRLWLVISLYIKVNKITVFSSGQPQPSSM